MFPSYYDREDVEQDAFLLLWQQTYDPACGVPEVSWRWRMAVRKLKDQLKAKTKYVGELDGVDLSRESVPPDARLDNRHVLQSVELSHFQMVVMLAMFEDGLTRRQIADRHGVPVSAVDYAYSKAKEKLREYLGAEAERPGDLLSRPVVATRHEGRGRPDVQGNEGTTRKRRRRRVTNLDRQQHNLQAGGGAADD